jgi:nucleotide-binding universal stress UspA family protein
MYKKILVPLDGSKLAECVLPHVEFIAKGCEAQSVVFIRVVEPIHRPNVAFYLDQEDIKRIESQNKTDAENYLKELVNNTKYDNIKVQSQVIYAKEDENIAEKIAEYATQNQVDLVVIATHGRSGVSRWAWGSYEQKEVRQCIITLWFRWTGLNWPSA